MDMVGAPEAFQKALSPQIVEAKGPGAELQALRPYNLEYRKQIEGDIAEAAGRYIQATGEIGQAVLLADRLDPAAFSERYRGGIQG